MPTSKLAKGKRFRPPIRASTMRTTTPTRHDPKANEPMEMAVGVGRVASRTTSVGRARSLSRHKAPKPSAAADPTSAGISTERCSSAHSRKPARPNRSKAKTTRYVPPPMPPKNKYQTMRSPNSMNYAVASVFPVVALSSRASPSPGAAATRAKRAAAYEPTITV